jgi:membrane fusion protein (multidrug efflux system)
MKTKLLLSALLIFLTGCHNESSNKSNKDNQSPIVEVTYAKNIILPKTLKLSGTVKSLQSIEVDAEVTTKIEKVLFKSAQQVQKNQLLVILEHTDAKAQFDQENEKLRYQAKNLHRYIQLANKNIISRDYLDNLQSQLKQQQSRVNGLYAELAKHYIRAPFSGVVGLKQIGIGQYIKSGDSLVNLQNTQSLIVDLSLPQQYLTFIRLGQSINIECHPEMKARIVAFDSHISLETHSLLVRIQITTTKTITKTHTESILGLPIIALLTLSSNPVLSIPASSISYGIEGMYVLTLKNKKVFKKFISAELDGDVAVIKKGLQLGEAVVNVGGEKLQDGDIINGVKTS